MKSELKKIIIKESASKSTNPMAYLFEGLSLVLHLFWKEKSLLASWVYIQNKVFQICLDLWRPLRTTKWPILEFWALKYSLNLGPDVRLLTLGLLVSRFLILKKGRPSILWAVCLDFRSQQDQPIARFAFETNKYIVVSVFNLSAISP